MRVELLSNINDLLNVLYTSARTCYNAGSPIDMWNNLNVDEEKKINLLIKCFKSGHLSVLEHANFTFAIQGISRACSHQLVRHRHCSFSQQSQRYVEIKEDIEKLKEVYTSSDEKNIANKYFIIPTIKEKSEYYSFCVHSLMVYLDLITSGEKAENARMVLPNCTKTNLVMTCNLRELIHICNERMCSKAQLEIRQLVNAMAKEVIKQNEWLKPLLQPKCEHLGYCPEAKSCGRK